MATGVQVVILCVGLESDLDSLVNGSGFLLPVAGKPLLYYPLQLLEQAGFSKSPDLRIQKTLDPNFDGFLNDIIVVVEEEKREEVESMPEKYGLGVTLKVIGVDVEDDCSTASILRLLHKKKLLKAEDILILPGDLVCDINLHQFADQHRVKYATLTALYSTVPDDVSKVVVPGPKTKHIPETEDVGIEAGTQRIVLLDEDKIKRKVFQRHPNILLRKLSNAHVYFLRTSIVNFLVQDSGIKSVQDDLVPLMVKSQFRSQEGEEKNKDNILSYATADEDYLEVMKLSACYEPDFSAGALSCYAFLSTDFCVRATTVQNYVAANRQMMKRQIPDGIISPTSREGNLISSVVPERCTITNSCIGEHCTLGERVRIANSIVTHHVTIEEGCSLTDCIVLDNAVIAKNSHLKECIVGMKFCVPAGTKSSNETFEEEDL